MKRYELTIGIIDSNYTDSLIVALVRQGYSVYYNSDSNDVCITVQEQDDLKEITK